MVHAWCHVFGPVPVGGLSTVPLIPLSLTPYPLMTKARLFKNPQDERAAFNIFSGLVTALIFKRKLDATDVVASLETLIQSIKENNPDVFTP